MPCPIDIEYSLKLVHRCGNSSHAAISKSTLGNLKVSATFSRDSPCGCPNKDSDFQAGLNALPYEC
jgi:hypothetical protein